MRILDVEAIHQSPHNHVNLETVIALADQVMLLEQELADAQAETLEQARLNGMGAEREIKLLAQLAACQAENLHIRGLLRRYRDEVPPGNQPHMISHEVDKALSTPPGDQSSMLKVIAYVLEEVSLLRLQNINQSIRQLRSGEWIPEVLK